MKSLAVAVLGVVDYQVALTMQEQIMRLRQENKAPDCLLLLQHPPTLTLGKRGKEHNILVPTAELRKWGVQIYRTGRGGDVTYHGPGQIVGYPILNLRRHGNSVKKYISKIGAVFIELLNAEYGLVAARDEKYHGVWVGSEKITAVGCTVKRAVTMHGFAFNVNTDLGHFAWINPCGITDKGVTSLRKLTGVKQDMDRVNQLVTDYFCRVFQCVPRRLDKQGLRDLLQGRHAPCRTENHRG